MTAPLVVAVAARGPLGLSSVHVAAGVRARKLSPRDTGLTDRHGRPVGVCRTGGLPGDLYGVERLVALGVPALHEVRAAVAGAALPPLPLVLALAEPGRPDGVGERAGELLDALAARGGLPIDRERSHLVHAGHAGGALAFAHALGLLDAGARAVLVGGLDSYLHPRVIEALDEGYRLHGLDTQDGIIPSEGAAFLLLARPARATPGAPLARVLGVEVEREEGVAGAEPLDAAALLVPPAPGAVNVATAMTRVLRRLLDGHPAARGAWVLSDVNGERHRVREWTRAAMRCLPPETEHLRLADDLGDSGAATGPLLAAIATRWWQMRAAPGAAVIVALHSEGPERGALLLEEAT